MKPRKKLILTLILLVFCLLIRFYASNETRVENAYSNRIFPKIGEALRHIFGSIPLSAGDFIYGGFVIFIIWKVFGFLIGLLRKQRQWKEIRSKDNLLSLLLFCAVVYLYFNIAWGINYNRKGIAWQLGLKMEKYEVAELREMNCLLIDKVNESKRALIQSKAVYPDNKALFKRVEKAYTKLGKEFPFLACDPPSLKSSLWGWFGNYAGFTGYYNPFTGEAQVNTTVPKFLQPYIACHEVAHQVGYAKEMEANFVGYLAAANADDTLFQYSCYLDLFMYTNRNLYLQDSNAAKLYRKDLSPAVLSDLKEWIEFNRKHRSFIEPVISWAYGKYLQSNRQPQGILSYDEVTAFLLAYYKKFGRI